MKPLTHEETRTIAYNAMMHAVENMDRLALKAVLMVTGTYDPEAPWEKEDIRRELHNLFHPNHPV